MKYMHKFYTRNSTKMPQNRPHLAAMLMSYEMSSLISSQEIQGNYFRLSTKEFSIDITIIFNESTIHLENTDAEFNPESEKLEYKIIGHFLHITGAKELVTTVRQIPVPYVTLGIESESLSQEKFAKLLALSPIKSP